MYKVLFVCIHNSARSQMAEAFANHYGSGELIAESAGIDSGKINPLVVRSMQEIGIDMSAHYAKTVASILEAGKTYDAVITVCDEANAARCPVFPGKVKRIAWFFDDPSALGGTEDEKLARIAVIREQISAKVQEFVADAKANNYRK
ncbi:MAG: arsenate reductase ArsC [Chitinophagaceae bacterium]|nr:arsenate reductase ArsC [Chitinophagaceae bacterium]